MEHWDEGVYMRRAKGSAGHPPLILSCGVHGDEMLPVLVMEELLQDILAQDLTLQRPCLIIMANNQALLNHKRFMRHNMNRLFGAPSRPSGYESRRALALEGYCKDFAELYGAGWHLDLHSSIKPSAHTNFALMPASDIDYSARWVDLLAPAGFSALVRQFSPAHTFSHFTCNQLGYESLTLECGAVGSSSNAVSIQLDTLLRALLTNTAITPPPEMQTLQRFDVVLDLIKHYEDFQFVVDEKSVNFSGFNKGTVLAKENGEAILAPQDCALLFANSNVPVGDRAGLVLGRRE